MTDYELLKQCFHAFESVHANDRAEVMVALRARLAQQEQEPVAWTTDIEFDEDTEVIPAKEKGKLGTDMLDIPLYTAPPQREWKDISTVESKLLWNNTKKPSAFAKAVSAKLKEYNA